MDDWTDVRLELHINEAPIIGKIFVIPFLIQLLSISSGTHIPMYRTMFTNNLGRCLPVLPDSKAFDSINQKCQQNR